MELLLVAVLVVNLPTIAVSCDSSECRVKSPDGSLVVVVSDEGGLHYRTVIDEVPVVKQSRLGLVLKGEIVPWPTAAIESTIESQHNDT